ncbi:MAG: hypothetical protein KDD41_11395 [Flavobacteriales bacterium]|nr:hypothetical protein [Flavobacteriales bacterium]
MEEQQLYNNTERTVSPMVTFLSFLGVCVLLVLIMLLFPKDGIKIGNSTIQFLTFNEFFLPEQSDSVASIEEDLAILFDSNVVVSEIDSTIIKHRLDSLKDFRASIQTNAKGKASINDFFAALENANNKKVRIMHYGDSQIEADRITAYLRNELQIKFGGYGPGLFPVIPVARKMSVNTEYSENWKRYAGFGVKDSSVTHKKYGALMAFCRYAPIPKTTVLSDSLSYEGWIKIHKPKGSYGRTRSYQQLRIFLSNSLTEVKYRITADGVDVNMGTIASNTPFKTITTLFEKTPEEITITFSGKDSPDIYGLSLEGNTGVVMDNIPLRGSSGTVFTKQDAGQLGNMYASLSPSLIIMEFGGNTIPYTKSVKDAKAYGSWFQSQINFMKRLNPGAAIIVIGPSDMSVKEKTEYVTYEYLEAVRDAMKEAALNTGSLFWDMYEVMGGKNTMPKWVEADPPLAAPDYIHFSPKGAKKMAEEFSTKLFDLYNLYKDPNYKSKEPETKQDEKKQDETAQKTEKATLHDSIQ